MRKGTHMNNKSAEEEKVTIDAKPVTYLNFNEPSDNIKAEPKARNADNESTDGLERIIDVPLQVSIELGRVKKTIKEVLSFDLGSIIILDKLAGDMVDVVVNGKPIATGEVIVIDENYGVRITEVLNAGETKND